ncbi:MAG: hypothetical protein WBQ75_18825 [Acetobacteraceae bacterium]
MADSDPDQDIELKFDGKPVRQLGGAPAELVADSLRSLQRMAYLIGMKREGQRFGHKARPNAKVRRTYAVVCRTPEAGSYLQPWNIASSTGQQNALTAIARGELLKALQAFDSDDDARVAEVLPDPRQRWFLADAALGLLPPEGSEIEVSVRVGAGRYSFQANRARAAIERTRAGDPPIPDSEEIVGKLKALDFSTATMTVKPTPGRQIRVSYPLKIEPFLQHNVRRRLRLTGSPEMNGTGDIVGFSRLNELTEAEPSSKKIEVFKAGPVEIKPARPYGYLIGFDFSSSTFFVRDAELGLDAFATDMEEIEDEVRADLDVLWRTYATASDRELTPDAQILKRSLRARFRESN